SLGNIGRNIEPLDEGSVVEVQDLQQKFNGGVLLELEPLADGAAGIEHDADTKRQIRLLGETEYGFGRPSVIEQAEVLALQTGDEAALLVGNGKDEVDFVDLHLDGGDRLFGRLRLVLCRCLGRGLRCCLCCRLGRWWICRRLSNWSGLLSGGRGRWSGCRSGS